MGSWRLNLQFQLLLCNNVTEFTIESYIPQLHEKCINKKLFKLPNLTFALSITGGKPAGISNVVFKLCNSSGSLLAGVQVTTTWKAPTWSFSKWYRAEVKKAGKVSLELSCSSVVFSPHNWHLSLMPANCSNLSRRVSWTLTAESASSVWSLCARKQKQNNFS